MAEGYHVSKEPPGTSSDWDPTATDDLYPVYDALRERCPVAYTAAYDSSWLLTRYADVVQAARDFTTFPSGRPFITHEFPPAIPLTLNPPDHTVYRRALNRYFGSARMEEMEPFMRSYATAALTPMLHRGHGDVAVEVAQVVPARGLCALLNMPDKEWQPMMTEFRALMDGPGTFEEKAPHVIERVFLGSTVALVNERKRHPLDPEHDLISGILAMEVNGQPLADEVVIAIGLLMFAAGHDTTANAITSAIHHLARAPDDQDRLREDPSLITAAVEELLRLHPSLHIMARRTSGEVEIADRQIPAGQLVGLGYASANRDGAAFSDPDDCILDRSPNKHLSFGHGVHKCLGAPLARLELQVVLEELLARTSGFELAGAPERVQNNMFNGYSRLPLRLETIQSRDEDRLSADPD